MDNVLFSPHVREASLRDLMNKKTGIAKGIDPCSLIIEITSAASCELTSSRFQIPGSSS